MHVSTDWNPLVPAANRFDSPNTGARKPQSAIPTHIVIHVTGTNSLASVKKIFMAPKSVSAHYLVGKDGQLYQFARDATRAWHAGIDTSTRALYKKGATHWQCYLKYFPWYSGYPPDAVFLDGDLHSVRVKGEAAFVAQAGGQRWKQYDYFNARWPLQDLPVNFGVDPDPNNYSIGIETLGLGAPTADPAVYPDAMYKSLARLVADLSGRYSIPMKKGRVVGHEDVNPIGRFGWDPAAGFDWGAVWR